MKVNFYARLFSGTFLLCKPTNVLLDYSTPNKGIAHDLEKKSVVHILSDSTGENTLTIIVYR